MSIRSQTSRGNDIPNERWSELSISDKNWAETFAAVNRVVRTLSSPKYNCHGFTFGSRRTRIFDTADVNLILRDDEYAEVTPAETLPGDVVLYLANDGEITHSGIVVDNPPGEPRIPVIVSKWGSGPEIIHRCWDVHAMYRGMTKFYRCRL